MSLLNGDRPDPAEENRKNQDHGAAVNQAFAEDDDDTEYIREVTDTELQHQTVEMLDNLLSKDFVLSNMSEAEVHEQRWIARIVKLMVETQHPHADSMWEGRFRQVASGRADGHLNTLSEAEKTEILEVVQGFIARVARSREGWQQQEISKSYAVSERVEKDGDGGGWMNR
jgi:hypothetical protein